MPTFTANIENGKKIYDDLEHYMETNVLKTKGGKDFICKKCPECETSCEREGRYLSTGHLHHVGHLYDLKRDGKPFRVVVSGAENGSDEACSQKERTEKISSLVPINPHMVGTFYLLQMLFQPDQEITSENLFTNINDEAHWVFEAFSLANFLLCSAFLKGETSGTGAFTGKMQENCIDHFDEALKILQPDILITQGTRSWGAGFFERIYDVKKSIDLTNPEPLKIRIEGNKNEEGKQKETLLLPLYHPSYITPMYYWGRNAESRENYLKPAVKKLLEEYDKMHSA